METGNLQEKNANLQPKNVGNSQNLKPNVYNNRVCGRWWNVWGRRIDNLAQETDTCVLYDIISK